MSNVRLVLYGLGAIFLVYTMCFKDSGSDTVTEEVEIPTQGVETILKEVELDKFLIEDEITVADTSQSLIVANYLDGGVDTFTLQQVKLMAIRDTSIRRRSLMRAASFGLFGYMMGRNMGYRPSASAYTNQSAYNKVNNGAARSMRSSASRVTRTVPGSRSGFGKSSRSYGG